MFFLLIEVNGDSRKVLLKDINYINKDGRKLCIHTIDETLETYSSIGIINTWLDNRFYKSHGSLIVNLANIDIFGKNEVWFTSGDSVHIGIHNLRITKNEYKNYLEKTVHNMLRRHKRVSKLHIIN